MIEIKVKTVKGGKTYMWTCSACKARGRYVPSPVTALNMGLTHLASKHEKK